MTDETFDLSRRKLLGSLGAIGVASAGAGAGTFAYFSDTESSTGNTVSAGTLDLTGGIDSTPVTINASGNGVKPGDSGTVSWSLTNSGSLDGSVDINIGSPSTTQSSSSEARDDAQTGVFETTHGFGTNSGAYHSLKNDAGYPRNLKTTVDHSADPVTVDIQLPKALDSSSGDNIAVALDLDNDGFGETQLIVQPGNSTSDSDGLLHKDSTAQDGFWVGETSGPPEEIQNVTYDSTAATISFEIPLSTLTATNEVFGIGGQLRYNGEEPGSPGQNFVINLTPGFGWAPGFNSDSSRYATIDGSLRDLSDVLNLDFYLDSDYASDSDLSDATFVADSSGDYTNHEQTHIAQGKPSRIDREYDSNEGLQAGDTTYLVMEWEVPPEAQNAIQGQQLTFDLEAELNQTDGQ